MVVISLDVVWFESMLTETLLLLASPLSQLTKQSIAIQGKKQGGDTLHVRCT